jgi:hypothetical protein
MLQKLKDTKKAQAVADMHYGFAQLRQNYFVEESMHLEVARSTADMFVKVIESVIGKRYTNKLLYIIERPEWSNVYLCMYVYDGTNVGFVHMADKEREADVTKAISKYVMRPGIGKSETVYAAGMPVTGRDGKDHGRLTGATHKCQMTGCTGTRLTVAWGNGKFTYPCSKGMAFNDGVWRVL